MNKIIALVGMSGSGKSETSKYLLGKDYKMVYFGQATLDELAKRKIEVNEKNEKKIREWLRSKYGMGVFALLNLPKIKSLLRKNNNVVIDGLYSWSEYKVLIKEFKKKMTVLAVFAPLDLRYQRLKIRKKRPLSHEESQSRDYAEIENLEKGGPIAMANYTIINDGSLKELYSKIDKVLKKI